MAQIIPITQKPISTKVSDNAYILGTQENDQGQHALFRMPISSVRGGTGESYDDTPLKERLTSLEEGKVDKVSGKGLSTNDYTDKEADRVYEAWTISKQANKAVSFESYISLTNMLNLTEQDEYNVGQSIYIQTLNVPDLWVYSVDTTSETYTYTSDEQFISDLNTNGYVKVGYYKLAQLETQKVDLTNYVEKVEGKGLSTNDYTDHDKRSVEELDNSYGTVKRTVDSINNTVNINDAAYLRIRGIQSNNIQSLNLYRGSAFVIPINESKTYTNITVRSDNDGVIYLNSDEKLSGGILTLDIPSFTLNVIGTQENYISLPEGDYVAYNNRLGVSPAPSASTAYTEIKVKNPGEGTKVYNVYNNYGSFHIAQGGTISVRLIINTDYLYDNMFFKLKIEQGNTPTAWTPQLPPITFNSDNFKDVYLANGFNLIKGTESFSITYAADIDLAIQNNDFPILPEGTINDNDLIEFVNPTANKRYTIKKKDLRASLDVPAKTSDLENDSGFLTLADLPLYDGGVN